MNIINLALDLLTMEEVQVLGNDFQFMLYQDKLLFSPFRKDKWLLRHIEIGKDYIINQYVLDITKIGEYII
jgi:hypothetical protein